MQLKSGWGFISMCFKKRKAKEEKFQMKLMNCKNKKERDTFCASETSFDAHKLYSTCLNYQTSCTLLHKTLLICLNIFCNNTIIVYVIVFFRYPFCIFVYFLEEYSSAEYISNRDKKVYLFISLI